MPKRYGAPDAARLAQALAATARDTALHPSYRAEFLKLPGPIRSRAVAASACARRAASVPRTASRHGSALPE